MLPLLCCGQAIDTRHVAHLPLSAAAAAAFAAANEEATATDGLYCPVPSCSAFVNAGRLVATLPPAAARKIPCPTCGTRLCLLCKGRAYGAAPCAPAAAGGAATAVDIAPRALAVAERWQACPSCQAVVSRVAGCAHMICRCGAPFCYHCGVAWKECGC